MVTQVQLWNGFVMFDELALNHNFEINIIIFPENSVLDNNGEYSANLALKNEKWKNVIVGRDANDNIVSRKKIIKQKSIIFYESVDMSINDNSWNLLKLARRHLLFYIPYNVKVIDRVRDHYQMPIHSIAHTIFSDSPWHLRQFKIHGYLEAKNAVWIGSSKLEGTKYYEAQDNRGLLDSCDILIAPHWTLLGKKIGIGAFEKYYLDLLQLPKLFPKLRFILRPHPNWATAVIESGLMTNLELSLYIENWNSNRNCSYLPNERTSEFYNVSAVITDSGSFLAEFLPSMQPFYLLHTKTQFNEFGKTISHSHYTSSDFVNMFDFLNIVILGKNDFKRLERERVKEELIQLYHNQTFSKNLRDYTLNLLMKN